MRMTAGTCGRRSAFRMLQAFRRPDKLYTVRHSINGERRGFFPRHYCLMARCAIGRLPLRFLAPVAPQAWLRVLAVPCELPAPPTEREIRHGPAAPPRSAA